MEVIINGIVYVPKENKLELELLKKKYETGDYICVFQYLSSEKNCWAEHQTPKFTDYIKKYKLIHKKHKSILDAYLIDNSVEIEYRYLSDTIWSDIGEFINSYNEKGQYRLKHQYPIFKRSVNGIFKQTSEYDCEWVFHKNSYAIGNQFREYTGSDIVETILYDKQRGLYHLQPVWCWNRGMIRDRRIGFYHSKEDCYISEDLVISLDFIEQLTPEQLKTMPFMWDMYQQFLKDKQ